MHVTGNLIIKSNYIFSLKQYIIHVKMDVYNFNNFFKEKFNLKKNFK